MQDSLARLGLKHPLIVAPMAGGPSSPELVIASSAAGALGSIGAAYSNAAAIAGVVEKVRAGTGRPFAINLFVQHPAPHISEAQLARAVAATAVFRDELRLATPPFAAPYEEDFDQQFEAVLRARPAVLSFVFGVLAPEYMRAARNAGMMIVGTATTPDEAQALEESGVDAITLQGFEAGGHRGIFDPEAADSEILLEDLLVQSHRRVKVPLIAAGGLMTGQDVRAALAKGASAVQLGTAFLATSEAGTSAPYRTALKGSERKTRTTRAFSGRFARGVENRFMNTVAPGDVMPFPAQNKFTRDIRAASTAQGSPDFLSLWAGTGKGELWQGPAAELIEQLFAR